MEVHEPYGANLIQRKGLTMGLFGRLFKRRENTYDPYFDGGSKDNPELTEFGSRFVYKTLEYGMLSTWMMVDAYDGLLPDTWENIILGIDDKMSDPDAIVESFRGYMFEMARLITVSLSEDTDAYTLALLTSDEDKMETESMSHSARVFIAAVLDEEFDSALNIARTVCEFDANDIDDVVLTYVKLMTTVMTLVTREWFAQAFPEFSSEDKVVDVDE